MVPELLGGGNARRCRSSAPRCTLGQRRCTKVLPKRAVLHPRATISMVFVAEGFPSSILHSALRPWATGRRGSVAQACRAALSGDDIGLKCCLRWGVGSHRSTSLLGRAVELHRWDTPWNCTGASTLCGYTGYTMLRAVKRRR